MPQLQDNPNSLSDIAKGVWASEWIQKLKGQINGLYSRVNSQSSGSTGTSGIDDVLAQAQSLTTNRSIVAAGNNLSVTGVGTLTLNSSSLLLTGIPSSPTVDIPYNRSLLAISSNAVVEDTEYFIKPTSIATTTTTPTAIYTLPKATYIPNSGDTIRIEASLLSVSGNNRAWQKIEGLAKNIGGTLSVVGTVAAFTGIKDGALTTVNCSITTDTANNIFVNVIGIAVTNITWSGEVTFRIN